MATTTESSLLTPSLFNIQYPNCRRGMFSLRQPFKDIPIEDFPTEPKQPSARRTTPATVEPAPPMEEKPIEPVPIRQKSKRNAHVQCSLLTPNVHHDMAVQTKINRQKPPVNYYYVDNDDISPRYHRHKKSQPIQQPQKIYEIWDVESPPPQLQVVPINQTIRYRELPRARHRKPIIEYPDEEEVESDYNEERIIYARQPQRTIKKTYLPPNVRMICVRDDANRVSY